MMRMRGRRKERRKGRGKKNHLSTHLKGAARRSRFLGSDNPPKVSEQTQGFVGIMKGSG